MPSADDAGHADHADHADHVVCVDFGVPVQPPDASAVTDIGDRYRMYRNLGARIQRDVEALSLRRQAAHV